MKLSMRRSGGTLSDAARKALTDARSALPHWHPGMTVRCPMKNRDGSPISEDDIPGCGSANVTWAGDVYDCRDCGIFFCDYAADPPHQREDHDDAK